MRTKILRNLALFIIGLVMSNNNLFSQVVTDTPSYFNATIHFPSELNAKVLTRDASYAYFEREYTNHMEDISLNVTMYVERAEDDMFTYLANEYKDIVASLTRRGCQISYKTFNKEKKVFMVSWTANGIGYYLKCHLRGNALYSWTLSWDKTDSETHRRAKAYIENRQIYYTWR